MLMLDKFSFQKFAKQIFSWIEVWENETMHQPQVKITEEIIPHSTLNGKLVLKVSFLPEAFTSVPATHF